MTEWREVTLGDALEIRHGYAFKGEHFVDDGNLIVLTPGNFVDSGGFKAKTGNEKFYEGPVPEKYLLGRGDVVIAMTEQAEGLLGSSATIPRDSIYLHNQRIGLVKVSDPETLDLRFVYHLMNVETVRQQLQATATGTKVRHTAPARIAAVRVRVPSVATQRRIALVLDAMDDLIENERRRMEVLEEMARAIYREWFVHFRFPGHEETTFVDSDLGPIPHDWEVSVLDAVVEQRRKTVGPGDVDDDTSLVGLEHIPRRQLTLDDWATARGMGSRKTRFEAGDVLFGKIRPYFHKVALAPMAGICSTDALVLDTSGPHRGLAIMALSSDEVVAYATRTANGTKMPRANWGVMKSHPMALPPEQMTVPFSQFIDDVCGMATSLMFGAKRLGEMRDLLRPKLVLGKIDVSDLDLDVVVGEARI